jgi:cellulose synthase (UDP-forming)
MQQAYMVWISNRTYAPLVSSAIHVFTAFRLFPSVVATLFKPFGAPFRVTPKASVTDQKPDWFTAGIIAAAWIATVAGVLLNTFPGLEQIPSPYFFPVAMFWSTFSLATLTVAFWIAIPRRYQRKTHRFTVQLDMSVELRGVRHILMVNDMSMGGALLEAGIQTRAGDHLTVILPDGTALPAIVVRASTGLGVAWEQLTPLQYRRLVEFLFCGKFMAAPQKASESNEILAAVFKTLWR